MSPAPAGAAGPRPAPRVLMVAATPYFADRGCHVRIQGEARALEAAGADVTIVTYRLGRDVPGGRIVRAGRLPGYRRIDAAPAAGKLVLDLGVLWAALRAGRRLRPDVVHAHTQEGGLIGLAVGRLLGRPVVVDLQSRRVAEELVAYGASREGGLLFRVADRFDRAIPRRAAAVVASTEAIAAFVRASAAPAGPVEVLADAIDVPAAPPARDAGLARSLGLDPERPTLAYLGILSELQGVDLLLAALARLAGGARAPQLLLMGYPDEPRWAQRARDLGVADRVRITGRVPFEDSLRYLALGTLGVSAKRATVEGNGKLLSYMAAGLPVLALDGPTSRELLGPDGLFADDDPDAFAGAVSRALADPADLARRAARLRERARATASWEARGRALLDLYRRLAPAGVAGGR